MPRTRLSNITNIEDIEKWLINISINQSAVRNHGNGIVAGIRHELRRRFKLGTFIKALKAKSSKRYVAFLDELTRAITGKPGRDENDKATQSRITWGAARKCINLLARTVVYNGFIWQQYNIKLKDFRSEAVMNRLELPLDRYSVNGIIKGCKESGIIIDSELKRGFTIIRLSPKQSRKFQILATQAALNHKTCRVHLDIIYWRNNLSSESKP